MAKELDHKKLYNLMNAARNRRRVAGEVMSWNKVATRAGIAPTTLNAWTNHQSNPDEYPKYRGISLENFINMLEWVGEYDLRKVLKDEDE